MSDQRHYQRDGTPGRQGCRIDVARLKKACETQEWSEERLAEELANVGYTKGFSIRTLQVIKSTGSCSDKQLAALADVLDLPEDDLRADAQEPWAMPKADWDPNLHPPGALLTAEMGIVPFHFRSVELDALKYWCGADAPFGISIYVGAGGMGKTRLALKLCRDMRDALWCCGFINYSAFRHDEAKWAGLFQGSGPLLFVFDYAENHLSELEWLLPRLAKRQNTRTRILLLARAAGDWLTQLKSFKDVGNLIAGPATSIHSLTPLAMDLEARRQSYQQAAKAFAQTLGKAVPSEPDIDFTAPHFARALLLHMTALANVEGVKVEGEDGILDYVLSREQRHWARSLETCDLAPTLVDGLWQAMAAITYADGLKRRVDGLELLRCLPFFEDQTLEVLNAINHLLHNCYPGDPWIEPVRPDLLGERLYERAFGEDVGLRKAVFKAAAQAANSLAKHAGSKESTH